MDTQLLRSNPFPGLRHFDFDDAHLFFGREGQSEEILRRLRQNRFLAVIGTSGSGKSSLIRAGLLPYLYGGFMPRAGSHWRVAILRPGNDPIGNLAKALNQPDVLGVPNVSQDDSERNALLLEVTLRQSGLGLIEVVRLARLSGQENVLVIVDQFEELFRFADAASTFRQEDDAAAFVKLLLEATRQTELAIYTVLTMRSDFIGDCARFQELPEAVNEGLYLIPRMTREQRREAIERPTHVGKAEISRRLVNRLLNDVGDSPDQLPILQHALMRTWDYWVHDHSETEPLDLRHYEAIGGMTKALSRHAEEAYEELPGERHREIAKRLFQSLTEKGPDNREVRRPVTVANIAAVASAETAEVISVIESFRRPGRSFLMPPASVALDANSVIDISHESLIRGWQRLRDWVDKESESARTYKRLADTAVLHAQGKANLWHDPDLQIALEWRDRERPNAIWAGRYHPGFEQAMAFLDASAAAQEAEEREKERRRREELQNARRQLAIRTVLGLVALVLACLAGLSAYKYAGQKGEAVEAKARAEAKKKEASDLAGMYRKKEMEASDLAGMYRKKEIEARGLAGMYGEKAKEASDLAEKYRKEKRHAEQKEEEALGAKTKAEKNEKEAQDLAARLKAALTKANDTQDMGLEYAEESVSAFRKLSDSTTRLPDVESVYEEVLQKARGVSDSILAQDSSNKRAMVFRIINLATLPDLHRRQGKLEKADEDCARNAREGEKLAQDESNYFRRMLGAVLFASCADTYTRLGKREVALQFAARAVTVGDTVWRNADPKDDLNWRLLSTAYNVAGGTQRQYRQNDAALKDYQKAVEARKKVIKDRASSRRTLVSDIETAAALLKDKGEKREALKAYSEAVDVAEKLVDADKPEDESINTLFWSYVNRGDAQRDWREFDEADRDYRAAAKWAGRLAADTDDGRYDRYIGTQRFGNLQRARAIKEKDPARAQQELQDALTYHKQNLKQAWERMKTDKRFATASAVAMSEYNVGRDYLELMKKAGQEQVQDLVGEARKHYLAQIDVLKEMAQLAPGDDSSRAMANGFGNLEQLEAEARNFAASREATDKQINILRPLADRQTASPEDKRLMAGAYGSRSWCDLFLGDFEQAIQDAETGLKYDSEELWILTNEAHGYLFAGKIDQARQIYIQNAHKRVNSEQIFKDAVLDDFNEFRKHRHPKMNLRAISDIEELLGKQLAEKGNASP